MPSNDVLTRNDNGDLSVRTVSATEQATVVNKDDVYTRDTDGNLAVRTVGGSGGGGGAVSSVNGKTGAVVLDAEDVGALPADTTATDLGAVPQYEELPTASADNLGEIAQYSGETSGGTGTATISQTVGSGMTDLAVNTQTFIEEEQPTESGNFNFVCTPSVTLGAKEGDFTAEITDVDAFFAELQKRIGSYSLDYVIKNFIVDTWNSGIYYFDSWNVVVSFNGAEDTQQAVFPATVENGVTITGNPQSSNYQQIDSLGWFKKGDDYVNLDDYGITYGTEKTVTTTDHSENVSISSVNTAKFYAKYDSIQHTDNTVVEFAYTADGWYFTEQEGVYYTQAEVESEWGVVITGTPVADEDWADMVLGNVADCETGDTLTVALTFTAGATNGYFYKSEEKYSDPTATISQTVGSGLTNLAVDLDTFVAQEQPTQSENVAFVANVIPADTLTPTEFEVEGGVLTVNPTTFLSQYRTLYGEPSNVYMFEVTAKAGNFNMTVYYGTSSSYGTEIDPVSFGFSYTGDLSELTGETVCQMDYSYSGETSWEKSGNTVDLADYGITYTGTPVDDDTLTVVYTAPVLTGYAWNQINVQPQPEIPEPEPVGIKWATSVDLPENYGYPWDCYPIYTIAGGLPDGTYDFYWQIKVSNSSDYATGLVTYHARMKINNTDSIFYGEFSPVINDGWLPTYEYIPQSDSMQQFLWDNGAGTDLMIFGNYSVWKSNYPRQITSALPECFKISVIKNVDTGVEYTPTGVLFDGSYPQYTRTWSGSITTQPLAPTPYVPVYHTIQSLAYTSSNRYMFIGERVAGVKEPVCSEYDFSASTSNGKYHIIIENLANGYVARVIEASGDLATAQVGLLNNDLYFDFNSAGNSGNLKVSIGTKGSSAAPNCYFNEPSVAITPLDIANVGEPVTINNLGLLEQYKGATDANYTNGYFYKSEGTIVVTPASMVASDYQISGTPVNDITITIDTNSLISALLAITGWQKEYLENMLISQQNWNISYDFDNSTVAYVTWTYWGSIYDQSLLDCFTVSTTGSYSGQQEVFFTGTYSPESKSVTGGTWTRVNVQPLDLTGVTGYDATKTQVLKNVQGTLTWVDE